MPVDRSRGLKVAAVICCAWGAGGRREYVPAPHPALLGNFPHGSGTFSKRFSSIPPELQAFVERLLEPVGDFLGMTERSAAWRGELSTIVPDVHAAGRSSPRGTKGPQMAAYRAITPSAT